VVRATTEAIRQVALPAIAHWLENGRNHFVVLYHATAKRIIIGDPAVGLRKLPMIEFQKNWTGILLLLTPLPRLREVIQARGSFFQLCALFISASPAFLRCPRCSCANDVSRPEFFVFHSGARGLRFCSGPGSGVELAGIGDAVGHDCPDCLPGAEVSLAGAIGNEDRRSDDTRLSPPSVALPLSFFYSRRTGEIVSRLNDAIKIRVAVSATTLSIIVDSLLLLTTASVMAYVNWSLTLKCMLFVPALAAVIWLLNKPMKRHQQI
jgi:ATP-binding cassette subfamily B protein